MQKYGYKFSFGPWNIHEGADPFGPTVRPSVAFDEKLRILKDLGFDAMQFHDDDAVPDLDNKSALEIRHEAEQMEARLNDLGLVAEFVAPRLWEHPATIDGGFTANDPAVRTYAIERAKKAVDICPLPGHEPDGAVAGARGHVHARGQRRRAGHRAVVGSNQHLAGLRPRTAHRHRTQAQRAHGSGLHPHHRPRPGAGHAGQRLRLGWARWWSRPMPCWPGWTRPTR